VLNEGANGIDPAILGIQPEAFLVLFCLETPLLQHVLKICWKIGGQSITLKKLQQIMDRLKCDLADVFPEWK